MCPQPRCGRAMLPATTATFAWTVQLHASHAHALRPLPFTPAFPAYPPRGDVAAPSPPSEPSAASATATHVVSSAQWQPPLDRSDAAHHRSHLLTGALTRRAAQAPAHSRSPSGAVYPAQRPTLLSAGYNLRPLWNIRPSPAFTW